MYEQMQQDVELLRFMLCELKERQSSVRIHLDSRKSDKCKKGITALENAIDALQVQVYA